MHITGERESWEGDGFRYTFQVAARASLLFHRCAAAFLHAVNGGFFFFEEAGYIVCTHVCGGERVVVNEELGRWFTLIFLRWLLEVMVEK